MRAFRAVLLVMAAATPGWADEPAERAAAPAPTPEDHAAYPLAEAIAAFGCVLHQEETNMILAMAGVRQQDFPPMAIALLEDGMMRSTGNGTLTLVNWGPCTGAEAEALLEPAPAPRADAPDASAGAMPAPAPDPGAAPTQ